MKNKVFELFVCMMLICTCFFVNIESVSADQQGDYTYTISKNETTITKYTGADKAVIIPSTLGGYPVVSIGHQAFQYCTSITSVVIPDSVNTIGSQAFHSCTSLTSIMIPNNVTSIGKNAFYFCSSLDSVNIGNNVTTIGDQAFYSCVSLASINIPESVKTIGNSAFAYCSALTSIIISNSVISVGYTTFAYCSSLNSVTIGNSVTSIEDTTFAYCSALSNITLGKSVKSIGNSAFAYCSSLPSVIIPDSVTVIGDNAFYYCTALTNVTIGRSVIIIGKGAFQTCTSLTSITFIGVAAPVNVEPDWIKGTPEEIRGHAYNDSNFPAPGNIWNGLKMGEMLYRIIIENQPPIVNLNWAPKNPKTNEGVIFDVSWSYDPDGSIKLYEWDWDNDGIFEESHTNLITTHSWTKSGNYPVTLKVTDDDGANSTKTISISVGESTTPGFELIFVIFIIAISIILWKKKK